MSVRAFIAINLPHAERNRLWDSLAPLRAGSLPVRWTSPESIHLTIKFLGQVAERTVPDVEQRLQGVAREHPRFPLDLRGIGAFPSLRKARIWWVGVQPTPDLSALHAGIETTLAESGFDRDERHFAPHLTVGRVKGRRTGSVPPAVLAIAESIGYAATIPVRSVDLMQSHLGNPAARYECIAQAPLAPSHTEDRV
jgi:2'-5' RNA ligase